MKNFLLLLVLMSSISSTALASKPKLERYRFSVTFEKQTFSPVIQATNEFEALEKMAQSCFNHFGGSKMDKDQGVELIDVCANPKSI